jgi:hypothetical protein
MDLPAYPAFVFQNRTSAFIMPLRSHIHFSFRNGIFSFYFKGLAGNFQLSKPTAPGVT